MFPFITAPIASIDSPTVSIAALAVFIDTLAESIDLPNRIH